MLYYFAGETDLMGHEDHVVRTSEIIRYRLLSYYYHGMNVAGNKPSKEAFWGKRERGWTMFLDSGAFTAWTKKKVITCERYAEFIHNSEGIWDVMSSLDAIGDAEQSYQNFKRLLELGVRVQPVHHFGEPDYYLQRYIDEGWDYIFIGGMVGRPRDQLEAWCDHIWDNFLANSDGTPKVKTHGFGLTDMHLCRKYPWYSVDSSSWLMTGNFGSGMFWLPGRRDPVKISFSDDDRNKDAKNVNSTHIDRLSPAARAAIDAQLADMGVTREQAAHYLYRNVINAHCFAGLESRGVSHYRPTAKEISLW